MFQPLHKRKQWFFHYGRSTAAKTFLQMFYFTCNLGLTTATAQHCHNVEYKSRPMLSLCVDGKHRLRTTRFVTWWHRRQPVSKSIYAVQSIRRDACVQTRYRYLHKFAGDKNAAKTTVDVDESVGGLCSSVGGVGPLSDTKLIDHSRATSAARMRKLRVLGDAARNADSKMDEWYKTPSSWPTGKNLKPPQICPTSVDRRYVIITSRQFYNEPSTRHRQHALVLGGH